MKKILLTFLLLAAIFSLAQAQGFRWQGVANDAAGNPVTQAVTLRFSILKNGAAVFVENQNPITPVGGQIAATVGGGTASLGTFSAIDWANGPYFLKVEMKIGSAAAFLDMGSSQILPVPMALWAANSGGGSGGGWSINNLNSFKLDGNVGLGMNNPAEKLQILGNAWLQGSRKLYFQGGPSDPNYLLESFVVPGSAAMRLKGYGGVYLATKAGDRLNVHDDGVYFHTRIVADAQIYSSTAWPAYHWIRKDNSLHYTMDLHPTSGDLSIYNQTTQKISLQIRPNSTVSVPILEIRGGSDIIEKVISTEKTHPLQPGEVVIMDENNPLAGRRSTKSYQKQVIGVVSGAGGVSHGLELKQEGVLDGDTPIAVAGRVKVKVIGKVQPGDLLTTSPEPGKAMKAKNIFRKNGAIIGKALSRPDAEGLVLMLVNLQ